MIADDLKQLVENAQAEGIPIVLVTGVFDLLHDEHQNFLVKAQELGGLLVIGIESDTRVRQLKGEGRPIQNQTQRQAAIQALTLTPNQAVFILPETFDNPQAYRQLLAEVQPTILAVSSHSPYLEVKQQMMAEIGGVVRVVHQHNPAVSTTQILTQRTQ